MGQAKSPELKEMVLYNEHIVKGGSGLVIERHIGDCVQIVDDYYETQHKAEQPLTC